MNNGYEIRRREQLLCLTTLTLVLATIWSPDHRSQLFWTTLVAAFLTGRALWHSLDNQDLENERDTLRAERDRLLEANKRQTLNPNRTTNDGGSNA